MRARIEAPLEASLVVRHGDQVVRVPVAAILERPWHTPAPAPLSVAVEHVLIPILGSGGAETPGEEPERPAAADILPGQAAMAASSE